VYKRRGSWEGLLRFQGLTTQFADFIILFRGFHILYNTHLIFCLSSLLDILYPCCFQPIRILLLIKRKVSWLLLFVFLKTTFWLVEFRKFPEYQSKAYINLENNKMISISTILKFSTQSLYLCLFRVKRVVYQVVLVVVVLLTVIVV